MTTFQCIRKQLTLITDHSSCGANTNACHVLGSVAPGAPIQFSVHICHIFILSYKLRHRIGQELRCWKRGQNRQEEESILCYHGHITPSITLHPHGNCVDILQIKVLSIILVYTNLLISRLMGTHDWWEADHRICQRSRVDRQHELGEEYCTSFIFCGWTTTQILIEEALADDALRWVSEKKVQARRTRLCWATEHSWRNLEPSRYWEICILQLLGFQWYWMMAIGGGRVPWASHLPFYGEEVHSKIPSV